MTEFQQCPPADRFYRLQGQLQCSGNVALTDVFTVTHDKNLLFSGRELTENQLEIDVGINRLYVDWFITPGPRLEVLEDAAAIAKFPQPVEAHRTSQQ